MAYFPRETLEYCDIEPNKRTPILDNSRANVYQKLDSYLTL